MSDIEHRIAELERQVADLQILFETKGRRAYMSDVVRFQLPKALPDLARKYPAGVTTRHVTEHFGFPYFSVQQAVGRLVKAGKLVYFRRPQQRAAILLLPGMPPPPEPIMTPQRRRVLSGLIELSENGNLSQSIRQMSSTLGMDPSTTLYHLTCLINAKKVKLIKRGTTGRPNTYFIPEAIQ